VALLIGTRQVGAVVTLRGPRGGSLEVTAPDGLQLRIPAENGRAELWLPQPGEWLYYWTHGGEGTITVTPAPDVEPEPEHEPPAFTYQPGRR
jgi:hypothetical protein